MKLGFGKRVLAVVLAFALVAVPVMGSSPEGYQGEETEGSSGVYAAPDLDAPPVTPYPDAPSLTPGPDETPVDPDADELPVDPDYDEPLADPVPVALALSGVYVVPMAVVTTTPPAVTPAAITPSALVVPAAMAAGSSVGGTSPAPGTAAFSFDRSMSAASRNAVAARNNVSNSTTGEEILSAIEAGLVGGTTAEWSVHNPFTLVPATETTDGRITGLVIITTNNFYRSAINFNIVLPALGGYDAEDAYEEYEDEEYEYEEYEYEEYEYEEYEYEYEDDQDE